MDQPARLGSERKPVAPLVRESLMVEMLCRRSCILRALRPMDPALRDPVPAPVRHRQSGKRKRRSKECEYSFSLVFSSLFKLESLREFASRLFVFTVRD